MGNFTFPGDMTHIIYVSVECISMNNVLSGRYFEPYVNPPVHRCCSSDHVTCSKKISIYSILYVILAPIYIFFVVFAYVCIICEPPYSEVGLYIFCFSNFFRMIVGEYEQRVVYKCYDIVCNSSDSVLETFVLISN